MTASQTTRRELPEWIGRTPDTPAPVRVKIRVVARSNGCCAKCEREFGGTCSPQFDHIVALINGGENSESNLQALCEFCHKAKTALDVKEKAKVARVRAKHLGIRNESEHRAPVGGWAAKKFKRMPGGRVVDRETGETVTRRQREA